MKATCPACQTVSTGLQIMPFMLFATINTSESELLMSPSSRAGQCAREMVTQWEDSLQVILAKTTVFHTQGYALLIGKFFYRACLFIAVLFQHFSDMFHEQLRGITLSSSTANPSIVEQFALVSFWITRFCLRRTC